MDRDNEISYRPTLACGKYSTPPGGSRKQTNNRRAFLRLGEFRGVGLDDAHDDTEDAQGRGKDLNDEDLDEQASILRVRQSAAAPRNSHGNSTSEVGQAYRHPPGEERVRCEVGRRPLVGLGILGWVLCQGAIGRGTGRTEGKVRGLCHVAITKPAVF